MPSSSDDTAQNLLSSGAYIADTTTPGTVTIRRLRGPLDLVAWLVVELGCRHTATEPGFCLIDPPSWMWNSGLGKPAWRLGQWAPKRLDRVPSAGTFPVRYPATGARQWLASGDRPRVAGPDRGSAGWWPDSPSR
jgi:hypothetical protein